MLRHLLAVSAFTMLLAVPAAAQEAKPSFDCAKASTPVEHAICESPSVAALDAEMAVSYADALKQTGDAEALRRDQRDWAAQRGPACGIMPGADDDVAVVSDEALTCLTDLYQARFEQLTNPAQRQTDADPARFLGGLWQLKEVLAATDPAMTKADQQGRLIRLDRHGLTSLNGAGCAGPTLQPLAEAQGRPLDADEQALIQKAQSAATAPEAKDGIAGFCLGRLFALYLPAKDGSLLVADADALYRLQRLSSGTP
jgi:uncharacterized protein YecT (DUF1311 family)